MPYHRTIMDNYASYRQVLGRQLSDLLAMEGELGLSISDRPLGMRGPQLVWRRLAKDVAMGQSVDYSLHDCPWGTLLLASCPLGLCYATVLATNEDPIAQIGRHLPQASYRLCQTRLHGAIASMLCGNSIATGELVLVTTATDFELAVWQGACAIPAGRLATYGTLARLIGHPRAMRAVGSALGRNCFAPLVPCHRVVPQTGILGNYTGGTETKYRLLAWELTQLAQ